MLDKTGTVTEGKPTVTEVWTAPGSGVTEDEALRWAAAVEAFSEHPIARAVREAAVERGLTVARATDFKSVSGSGARAAVEGHEVLVGTARWLASLAVDVEPVGGATDAAGAEGATIVCLAVDGKAVAALAVRDRVRAGARAAIARLRGLGLSVIMLTGDRRDAAEAVAREVGIADVRANLSPSDKLDAIDALRRKGHAVAMVGDGINDAPALARATVGIALGSGTDVALETADVALLRAGLDGVPSVIALARRTLRTIHSNLVWAFAYNTLGIPVAAGVLYPAFGLLLSPAFAAFAMAMSSISVVLNSLRLKRFS